MFHAAMRLASISATAHASACSRIRAASSWRRSACNFFESSRPTIRRFGFRITAAANTGPKRDPRPASSRPAMRSQPLCRASRSYRVQHNRPIGRDSSTVPAPPKRTFENFISRGDPESPFATDRNKKARPVVGGPALISPQLRSSSALSLHDRFRVAPLLRPPRRRHRLQPLHALDSRSLALAPAQVIQLCASHSALPHHFDRADHRRVHRKNPLHANPEAHAPHRKALAQQFPAPAHHHAFKRLNPLFLSFAFLQPHVHANRIPRTERRVVFAEL